MDPNYFYIDWSKLSEVMIAIIVLSLFIERALSPLFESRFFINKFSNRSLKEAIAVFVSFGVCWFWKIDAISFVFSAEETNILGYFITGAIIAGGSKGSVKLFQDLLKVKSNAVIESEQPKINQSNT